MPIMPILDGKDNQTPDRHDICGISKTLALISRGEGAPKAYPETTKGHEDPEPEYAVAHSASLG